MNQHKPLAALEIRGLRKVFDQPAVDGLDLDVPFGSYLSGGVDSSGIAAAAVASVTP